MFLIPLIHERSDMYIVFAPSFLCTVKTVTHSYDNIGCSPKVFF